jgi:hypothetical protein
MNPFPENSLIINKVIYAKRFKTTNEQIKEIILLEIDTHLKKYPDLFLLSIGKPIENPDRSKTIQINFTPFNV